MLCMHGNGWKMINDSCQSKGYRKHCVYLTFKLKKKLSFYFDIV